MEKIRSKATLWKVKEYFLTFCAKCIMANEGKVPETFRIMPISCYDVFTSYILSSYAKGCRGDSPQTFQSQQ